MEKEKLNKELAKYSDEDSANSNSKVNEIVRLTDILENQPLQFNDELIRQMLKCVVVESKERIKVIFNDGTEIDQPMRNCLTNTKGLVKIEMQINSTKSDSDFSVVHIYRKLQEKIPFLLSLDIE